MAKDTGAGEKTEDATPKKLREAREEGQVGKSIEVSSVLVLLAGACVLYAFGYFMHQNLAAVMRESFTFDAVPDFSAQHCIHLLYKFTKRYALALLPVLSAVFVAALAANFLQVGFLISWKAIQPKFSKLNPISGFSRIISSRAVVDLFKNLLKVLIIGLVSWFAVRSRLSSTVRLYDHDIAYILVFILKVSFKIVLQISIVMAVLAFLDLLYQKWKFKEDQKMTKQEVKEEFKQTEGDPQVKARIRQLQAQAAKKRMMQEVPKSDVIVTNPTHLALAIRYDALTMTAPQVVAKGAGPVAQRIKEIARQKNIPVVENKQLARNLYKTVDVGGEIPPELYTAIAELLAYVYQLKGKSL